MNPQSPSVCVKEIIGTGWVSELTFAPDGHTLASSNWDGTITLWDMPQGEPRQIMTGHTHRVHFVAWSPDGRTLATSSRDRTIRLWDVEQGAYRAVLTGHTAGVVGLAFTPDSRSLLSGSEDGTLRVWDVTSGYCTRIVQGYAVSLYDVDWSPDGDQLVSGGTDHLVTVYAADTTPRIQEGHTNVVCAVSWSPDGRWIASSEWDNAVRLWNAATGVCVDVIQQPNDALNGFFDVEWSPDGRQLACGTWTHGIQIVEIGSWRERYWERGRFPTLIRPVAWSPDGTYVAGGGDDGSVYIWDGQSAELIGQLECHRSMITSLAWSADGSWLVTGSNGETGSELLVLDAVQGTSIRRIENHPGLVYAVGWNMDDQQIISGGEDGKLRWWQVDSGECVLERDAHQGTVRSLRKSPNGSKLASCGMDAAIMLWDRQTGDYLETVRRDRPYERVNITCIRGLTDAQKENLIALGAVEKTV